MSLRVHQSCSVHFGLAEIDISVVCSICSCGVLSASS
jgi:hypothetical protein